MSKTIRRRPLKVLWSEYKFYVLPCVQAALTLACYAVGYILSSSADGTPMARSGALATAISLVFTLWSYGDILNKGNRMSKEQFGRVIESMNMDSRRADAAKASYALKLDGQTSKIGGYITLAHTLILVVATLVWGFGDLVATAL